MSCTVVKNRPDAAKIADVVKPCTRDSQWWASATSEVVQEPRITVSNAVPVPEGGRGILA